ncbi:MAG TPA: hypothetical protein VIT65_21620 [Microlunatus sp.]
MMLLEVDPNLVRPGWTPLVVIVLLGIALFFLGRSMMKQFRRIDVPADHLGDPVTKDAVAPAAESSTERTPPIPDLRSSTPDSGRAVPPEQH